jgi:acyl-CoA thioesterase-1
MMLRSFAFLLYCLFSLSFLPAMAAEKTILVFGDSLSAGYGLARNESWPALLGQQLREKGSAYQVANASISGETTAGGRSRFDAALKQFRPQIVILALGANDGLRGLPVKQMQDNLATMVRSARQAGASVLIAGVKLPPNYGPAYTQDFEAAFAAVARTEKATLLPFLLEPIAAERSNFQSDGLHPVAAAQPRILAHVMSRLQTMLGNKS